MKLGIYANIRKPQVRETLQSFCVWAKERDLKLLSNQSLSEFLQMDKAVMKVVSEEDFIRQSDMVLVMGGDGTMLAAARMMANTQTPLLGVNLGGLGFLAEISINALYKRMEMVLRGIYDIQKRMVISANFISGGKNYHLYALNDIVIHRGGTSRILKIDVQVNHQSFNTYHADGIIIATPTGSTAYSLSSGGPILMPEMDGIILNPICPHTLTARPTVIPGDYVVSIRVLPTDTPASLTIDGQVSVALDSQTQIIVHRADYKIHSVVFNDSSFFDVLRQKLQWGGVLKE